MVAYWPQQWWTWLTPPRYLCAIFNPHSNSIVIRQGSVVEQVETVKVQQTIAEHENRNEVSNDSAARRVTLQDTGGLKGKTHMSRC